MAVLGRLLISSAERIDLPDLLSIDSYTAGDFKYLLKGIVGSDKPFVLKGFDVIDPQTAIGNQSCSIRVAESVVFYPGSTAGSFFHGLEEGHPLAAPIVPELRKNAVNYVYLTFTTYNTSTDTRAFWDPDKDGGVGGEFTQDINTESVLKVQINVSTGSFPSNAIPVAKIKVGALVIESITDARDMMFRLGSGGLNPDPYSSYNFKQLPTTAYARTEPPITMTSGGVNPFKGADKNIESLKEWMDAVMTKLRELGGTTYWYEDASTYSVISAFIDASATTFRSKGNWEHDASLPGLISWSDDIHVKVTQDPRTYIIRAGTKTLADEQVAYVDLQRKQKFNETDTAVSWTNGQNYVNTVSGALGNFENLQKGDWIKKIDDPNHLFLRVEEFYDAVNLGGSTTIPLNAKSVRLSSTYQGETAEEIGRFDRGIYESSDVVVSDKNNAALTQAGGNFHWLATRSDVIQNISQIETVALSGTLSGPDGKTAKIYTATPHGLIDGERITVTAPAAHAGTYQVEVEDANVFYIQTAASTSGAFTAFYALAVTSSRDNGYGLELESAAHGLDSEDVIHITDTTNYNGSYSIRVRSSTTVQFAFSASVASETSGTLTQSRINVRAEQGISKIVQGEKVSIGEAETDNIKQFVGMTSLSETHPQYFVPPSYDTLDGFNNYNSLDTDSLTARVSKLTAMMADKAQDKTIKFLDNKDLRMINNTTNGSAQEITFTPVGSTLTLMVPGSGANAVVALPSASPGISLLVGQVAYVSIDRNYPTLPSIIVVDADELPIDENIFIIAARLTDSTIYIWDESVIPPGSTPAKGYLNTVIRQNQLLKLVKGGIWSWDLSSNTLAWDSSAYLQIPGLSETVNEIAAGSLVLQDGQVAYIDASRVVPGGLKTPVVVNQSDLVLTTDRFVIARRVGQDVIIGNHSAIISHGDNKKIYGQSNSINRVRMVDISSTSLPSSATIDSVSISNGDKVLFTKLSTTSDRGIYVASNVSTAVQWTKLSCFNGSTNPQSGSEVWVDPSTTNKWYTSKWIYDGIDWRRADNADVSFEPTGFPNTADSTLSFSDASRTLTISPVGSSFDYYIRGTRFRSTGATSQIPNVEGIYFFYFENNELKNQSTFDISILNQQAYVATAYWDATNSKAIMLGDERHGLSLDWATHNYLHNVHGTQISNGFAAGNYTIAGTGSSSSDAQLSIADGKIYDEDLVLSVANSATPSLPFQQKLSPIANLPVYYRSGTAGNWRKLTATDTPLIPGTVATGVAESTNIVCSSAATITSGQYFTINAYNDSQQFFVWYRKDGLGTAPVVPNRTEILVDILTGDAAATVATKTSTALSAISAFSVSVSTSTVTVANAQKGWTTDAAIVNLSGFTATVTTQGQDGTVPQFNKYDGTSWSTVNADSSSYVAMWVFATNNIQEPVIAIAGQRQDATLVLAQENNRYETLSLGTLPSQEMKVLYRIIYKVDTNYVNTIKAALRDVRDLRKAVDVSVAAYTPADHGLLSGLTDQDHPASAIFTNTSSFNGLLTAAENDVQKALDRIDDQASSKADSFQDRNIELVRGGNWSWTLTPTATLSWSSAAYIQVPGIPENRNTIPTGSVALSSDGQVAYVDINRTTGASANLTISVGDIGAITTNNNRVIIARRLGNDLIVGNNTFRLIDGESQALEAGLSNQNLQLLGSNVSESTSDPNYASRGAVNRITSNSEGLADAVARHDAEFDKYFGQLRMIAKTSGTKTRVRITGADRVTFTGETIIQELSSLKMSFTGAEIDFATGTIYGGDATLPLSTDFSSALGINFTPATISANNYLWYSVAINPSSTNTDNTVTIQLNVLAGSASGSTPTLAVKPAIGGVKKLGYVVVKDNGTGGSGTILAFDNASFSLPAASAQSKVMQLGVGSGSGGGTGLQKVKLVSATNTSLPLGAVSIDSVAVLPDDLVLFTNLSSNNSKIYKAQGTVGNITAWQPQFVFNGSDTPGDGDTAIGQQGTAFAETIGIFNGTNWVFNDKIRQFQGANYYEQSALYIKTLVNNTSSPTSAISYAYAGSESSIIDYTIVRGATRETGTLFVTTDGTTAAISGNSAAIGDVGIVFSAAISGSNIVVSYVSTSTGTDATMKYSVKRWSDASGGPSGVITSYTPSSPLVNGLGFIVGSAAQVAENIATHTSINAAIAAASSGGRILVLSGTFTESVNVNVNNVILEGVGNTSVINGSLTVSANNCTVKSIKYNSANITGNSNNLVESWVNTGGAISDTGSKNAIRTADVWYPNRFTTTERNAISSPMSGSTVYNTTNSRLELYKNSSWVGVSDFQTGIPVSAVSANTTLTNSNQVVLVNTTSGNITITLPTPTAGIIINIKKIDSSLNNIVITPPSGTIDGTATRNVTTQYSSVTITSDGTNFWLI